MLKKLFLSLSLSVASFVLVASHALAAVDVNKADQAALDGVRGIGPSMSKRILDERQKGGAFKDWDDLQNRVKGIKDKAAVKLSTHGLTVNGQSKAGASATPAAGTRAGKSDPAAPVAPAAPAAAIKADTARK